MPSLDDVAASFTPAIVTAVEREYPNAIQHVMSGDDDTPTPRRLHPAFYGCFDWHSAVHMHWSLVRLLRTCPDTTPDIAREVLGRHLTVENIAVECDYFAVRPNFERPYGWGWVLELAAELDGLDDPDASRWAAAVEPLAVTVADGMRRWLGQAAYPVRAGMHANSAFALTRAWRWAKRDAALAAAITDAAERWFADDHDYPATWEPDGADFLSGALAEAELMVRLLPSEHFAAWFERFLPTVPESLLTPVAVSDPTDGHIAHLHGLNLYRSYGLRLVSDALGGRPPLDEAADRLLAASIDAVVGGHWMVEHWLATYAILALSPGD